MYSFLVDSNSVHKKCMKKNVVTTSHDEYKDVLWNSKCLVDSMSRIQSKDHRICLVLMTK